ncbi:MAG: hypothetical protein M0Z67_07340 [Nitrospiraceae bacterium]|nr:hypothetical protein [Nitrospiraceae bacterium]
MPANKNLLVVLILTGALLLALCSCKNKPSAMVEVIKNGDFSLWDQGNKFPDAWGLGGDGTGQSFKETSVVKMGNTSIRIVHISGGPIALYQDVDNAGNYKGRKFDFGCWINSKDANSAYLALFDGVNWQYSPKYSGSGQWEYLTAKGKFADKPSLIRAHLYLDNKATAYFSGASLTIEQ